MPAFDRSDAAKERRARLLVISTGTLSTAHLPFWLNWLSANRPHYDVRVGLTDSAKRFVSSPALAALTKAPVVSNTWDAMDGLRAVHTELATDYDGVLVYPASVAFLSGLASGSGTSPFFLAVLGTSVPVVIAPTFPPGVADNPIITDVLARLADVPNYHVVSTQKGKSRSIAAETDVTAPLWDAVAMFEWAVDATGAAVAPDTEAAPGTTAAPQAATVVE